MADARRLRRPCKNVLGREDRRAASLFISSHSSSPNREDFAMTKMVTVQAQQKWEYCFETARTENSLLVKLNDLGQHGWDLQQVLYFKDMKGVMIWMAYLKRPSAGQAPARPGETAIHSEVHAAPVPAGAEKPPLDGFNLDGAEFELKKTE
jgi:hypothetical protein